MPVFSDDSVTMTREEYMLLSSSAGTIRSLREALAAQSLAAQGEGAALRLDLGKLMSAATDIAAMVTDAGMAASECNCLRPSGVPDPSSASVDEICSWLRRVGSTAISRDRTARKYATMLFGDGKGGGKRAPRAPRPHQGCRGDTPGERFRDCSRQYSVCAATIERQSGIVIKGLGRLEAANERMGQLKGQMEEICRQEAEQGRDPSRLWDPVPAGSTNTPNLQNSLNSQNSQGTRVVIDGCGQRKPGIHRHGHRRPIPDRQAKVAIRTFYEIYRGIESAILGEDGRVVACDADAGMLVTTGPVPSLTRQRDSFELVISRCGSIMNTNIVTLARGRQGAGLRRYRTNTATALEIVGTTASGVRHGDRPEPIPDDLGAIDYPMGPIASLPVEYAIAREGAALTEGEREERNTLHWGKYLMQCMLWYKGGWTFDALVYQALRGPLYNARPLYVGGSLTQGAVCSLVAMFAEGLMAKRRTREVASAISGLGMDGSTLIRVINDFARVFCYPMFRECRRMMLSNCRVIVADETFHGITEGAEPGQSRKTYVWGMVSGPYEKYQLAIFHAGDGRGAGNFLDLLGIDGDGWDGGGFAPEVLVTDAYPGYGSASAMVEEATGRRLVLAECWAHAYRQFIDGMREQGTLGLFREALGEGDGRHYGDFGDRLLEAIGNSGWEPPAQAIRYAWLAMLISNVFWLDESVDGTDRGEALDYRREEVAPVVDSVFGMARDLAMDPAWHISFTRMGDGTFANCSSQAGTAASASIVYLLNQEPRLRAFLSDGRIPLTSNSIERALRPITVSRGNSHIMRSRDGLMAVALLQSLRVSCERNGIPFLSYLMWGVSEIKRRHEADRVSRGIGEQTFHAPPPPTAVAEGDDGKTVQIRISRYDPRYRCMTDRLPTTGLTPVDYKAMLLRRANLDIPGDQDPDP